jgi:hypothetical protein
MVQRKKVLVDQIHLESCVIVRDEDLANDSLLDLRNVGKVMSTNSGFKGKKQQKNFVLGWLVLKSECQLFNFLV